MRKLFVLIGCLLFITNLLSAQKKEDSIRTIINYGLSVYAADVNSFTADERKTLDSLTKHSENISGTSRFLKTKSGQLKNVGSNIEEWIKLANGSKNYEPLISTIEDKLKKPYSTDAKILAWRKDNVDAIFVTPVRSYLTPVADGATETTDNENEPPVTSTENSDSKPVNDNNMLLWTALALSILSLIGVAAVFFMAKRKIDSYHYFKSKYREEATSLWREIDQLKKSLPAQAGNAAPPIASEKVKELEAKIASFENKLKTETPAANSPKQGSETQPVVIPPPAKKVVQEKPAVIEKTLYAKLADLDNGFSESVFTEEQNGEQVFEITAKDNKASYLITNNANAQKYALSDYRYYLEKACDFMNEPSPNSRIDTKEMGELIKNGNNWIIQKKAIIQFV